MKSELKPWTDEDCRPECWAIYPEFPAYLVSDHGRVWSTFQRGSLMSPSPLGKRKTRRYLRVALWSNKDKRAHQRLVHQMVLLSFRGTPPCGMETRHLNGNPSDNKLSNLEYGTRKENAHDRVFIHRTQSGDACKHAKLTNEQAVSIRHRRFSGERVVDLAREFGVSPVTIGSLCRGRTWKAYGGPISPPNHKYATTIRAASSEVDSEDGEG